MLFLVRYPTQSSIDVLHNDDNDNEYVHVRLSLVYIW